MAVQEGAVDRALVPIENALEGAVRPTLDALAGEARDVVIVGEAVLAIRTCLIAAAGTEPGDVAVVLSHPQPLGQCAGFLRRVLPRAEVRAATSTAEAVRSVAEHGGSWAALGPRRAAERYGATVLAEGIDDDPDNATRFVWLAPPGTPPDAGDGPWKTSLVFSGAGDAAPGLAGALPVGVRLPRRQPHAHRVAAAAGPPRALPLPRRLRRRLGRAARRRGDRGPARPLRPDPPARELSGGLSGPLLRLDCRRRAP